MNPSQLIAWLICLALAFFAAVLAISNSMKCKLLERNFERVRTQATVQSEHLAEISDLLGRIEGHLSPAETAVPPPGHPLPEATTAAP